MALSHPSKEDVAHDLLRLSLLALATVDLGVRTHSSLKRPEENSLIATSDEMKRDIMRQMEIVVSLGIFEDPEIDSLAVLAALLAITTRDVGVNCVRGCIMVLTKGQRLAGSEDWEPPMRLVAQILASIGGPAAYIRRCGTQVARVIVEQLATCEVLGEPAPGRWEHGS